MPCLVKKNSKDEEMKISRLTLVVCMRWTR